MSENVLKKPAAAQAVTLNGDLNSDDVVRLPDPITRAGPITTIGGDLKVGARNLALLYFGEDSPANRRAIYYRFEGGRLIGAVRWGSQLAARVSTVMAMFWAEETKRCDHRTAQLMKLQCQLTELSIAMAGSDLEIGKLQKLLDATRNALAAVLDKTASAG